MVESPSVVAGFEYVVEGSNLVPRWPPGFERIPDEDWTRTPIASLAQKYDAVGKHGWYANLDASVKVLARELRNDSILVDYSGGTGLLIDRILASVGERDVAIVDVDSSPKFLALALEKLRDEPRVAFRLIRYLKEEKRLQSLSEAIGPAMLQRGIDALVSANAIHLYYGLEDTIADWFRAVKPGGLVHVQSGNIRNPDAPKGSWIIDDTVNALEQAAENIVRTSGAFARHRAALEDMARIAAHDAFRKKVFLPPRPLSYYLDALRDAGFVVERVWTQPISARADDWHDFLVAYSDAVLGWVGGNEKVEGRPPAKEDLEDRLTLMRLALGVVLTGKDSFDATWTYINARRP